MTHSPTELFGHYDGRFASQHGSEIERARLALAASAQDAGADCPCCGHFTRVYRRRIHHKSARWLIVLCRRWFVENRWFSVAEPWSRIINCGDVSKLAWWGLIKSQHQDPEDQFRNASGMWKPTMLGVRFARGDESVSKYAHEFRARLLGLTGKQITIHDCLGKHWRFDELMAEELIA